MSLKAGYKGFKTLGNGLEYNNQTGHLFLKGESDITLDNLKDVEITQPLDGDLLVYDSTTETWYNEQIDSDPVEDSSKPVSSGGVYAAVASRVDWNSYAKTGVHQLIPYNLASLKADNTVGTWANNVYTLQNHTFTVNDDLSITVAGMANTSLAFGFNLWKPQTVKDIENVLGKKITMSGVTGGTGSTYMMTAARVGTVDGSGGSVYQHNTAEKTFEWKNNCSGTKPYIVINIEAGVTVSETTVKPLLRYEADTDTSFGQYAETNLQLTQNKVDNSVVGNVENGTTASQAYAVGSHAIRNGAFITWKNAKAQGETIADSDYDSGDVGSEFGLYIPIANNAGFHNSIFRGKNLGSSLTNAQKTAIANGTFDDMFIGDYWIINSIKWRIAHFDYWYRSGDTQCTTHHVVVVPDNVLNYKNMNDKVNNADVTTGAYINSKMYTTNIADARTIVKNAFGESNILTHREYFANATNANGFESGGSWYDSQIDLMNEIMVYGSNIFHNCINGTSWPTNYTIDKVQLALFSLDQSYIIALNPQGTDRAGWWLRDVCNTTNFAGVGSSGGANYNGTSSSLGVRPAFGIK